MNINSIYASHFETHEQKLRAIRSKAEWAKQRVREALSEDAIFFITFVPFVIVEVVWDYADSIIDMAATMRLHETKALSRTIKQLRKEYDEDRYRVISNRWRKSETENMIRFQEVLYEDFFGKTFKNFKKEVETQYSDLDANSVMLIATVYCCKAVIAGLKRYCEVQEKIVASIVGFEITPIMPKQVMQLNSLIIEFAGDSPLANVEPMIQRCAEELANFISEVEPEDSVKSKSKQEIMEELKTLVETINAKISEFTNNAATNLEKGNKAAAKRARKASVELEKLMKKYRELTLKASK